MPSYDRDLWANPLRRLRGLIAETKDIHPDIRRHLNQTIDSFVDTCTDYFTQQAAAAGIEARWMAMRCVYEMRSLPTGSPEFKNASLMHLKNIATANQCFRIAKAGEKHAPARRKPPTSSTEPSHLAGET